MVCTRLVWLFRFAPDPYSTNWIRTMKSSCDLLQAVQMPPGTPFIPCTALAITTSEPFHKE